jgi:hypothetical protein
MPAASHACSLCRMDHEWHSIAIAPHDQNIEVCVIQGEPHMYAGACRLTDSGWIDALTKRRLDIRPTHWRYQRVTRIAMSTCGAQLYER